ncbi:DNA-3-methyladenine glycosylase [Patescibacteria group bacterium]|nr:DNA-3-methyladenine glycosylase [Patescibacteria group bacterium]
MRKVLKENFFSRPTLTVARELLGKYLVRKIGRKVTALKITEVEAYDGPRDKASHASRGRTARNAPMFGSAGRFYVYFTYGMHWMLNVVTGPENYPAAILICGTDKVAGPARLTKFLQIGKSFNGKAARPKTGLWLEDRQEKVNRKKIARMPRVGVAYAGSLWSKKPYRFVINCELRNSGLA